VNEVTDEMIKQHQRLVEHVIKNEISVYLYEKIHKLSREDLFQIGCIGLFKALQSYDENKNLQFSTHAYVNIRGEILNSVRGKYYGTKVKTKIAQSISAYRKEMKEKKVCDLKALQEKYDLTDEDLAEVIELYNKKFVSGEMPLGKANNSKTIFSGCGKLDNNFKRVLEKEE